MLTSDVVAEDALNTKPIKTSSSSLLSITLISAANNQSYFPYVSATSANAYEVGGTKNGQLITTSATSYGTPDNYGNFDTVSTILTNNDSGSPYFNDTWTTTTVNTITPDTSTWCLSGRSL